MARLNLQPTLIGRKPTHRLYRVLGDGKAAIWTPIGAAWPNKDGLGFNLQCDAVPLQGPAVSRCGEAHRGSGHACCWSD